MKFNEFERCGVYERLDLKWALLFKNKVANENKIRVAQQDSRMKMNGGNLRIGEVKFGIVGMEEEWRLLNLIWGKMRLGLPQLDSFP